MYFIPSVLKRLKRKKMLPSKSNKVIKRRKLPAKAPIVKASHPLKFLDSVLCHQPQLVKIIKSKPFVVSQHPASECKAPQPYEVDHCIGEGFGADRWMQVGNYFSVKGRPLGPND